MPVPGSPLGPAQRAYAAAHSPGRRSPRSTPRRVWKPLGNDQNVGSASHHSWNAEPALPDIPPLPVAQENIFCFGACPAATPADSTTGLSQELQDFHIDDGRRDMVNTSGAAASADSGSAVQTAGTKQARANPAHDACERFYCPVEGCPAADAARHPGWQSAQALRAHVDAHMLGSMPGRPQQAWLDKQRLVTCGQCGRLASRIVNNGIHRRCWARRAVEAASASGASHSMPSSSGPSCDDTLRTLPSIHDICAAPVTTREYLELRFLAVEEKKLLACVAEVIQLAPNA